MNEINFDLSNRNFEQAILSSIIFNPEQFETASKELTPTHFYIKAHEAIFTAINHLHQSGKPIDEEFIKLELERVGQFDERVMLEILSANPIANIQPYITELTNFKNRRDLLNISLHTKQAAFSEDPLNSFKELLLNFESSMGVDRRLPRPTAFEEIVEKEAEFILKDWLPIPKNTVSLVTAPGGSGKTWTVLQLAARFAMESRENRVFLWLSEDPLSLSKARLNKILEKLLKIDSRAFKIDLADDATPHLLNIIHNKVTVDPIWHDLKKIFDNYDLIILDPLIAFFGGDENNNGHARFFMQLFTEYAAKANKTIIFIHHSTKNTTGSRGAGAFVDAVRLHYEVDKVLKSESKEEDENKIHMRLIRLAKDNYNAGAVLKANEVERQVFPEVAKEVKSTEKNVSGNTPKDF